MNSNKKPAKNDSEIFVRKARGMNISRQSQRAFLYFDQADINDIPALIEDVLSHDAGVDCVVSWIESTEELDKNVLHDEIRETQVLIILVTNGLIKSIEQNGIPTVIVHSTEQNIPILPIAQNEGLFSTFIDKVGELHCIAKDDPEYRTKLKAQLENFLISEELKKNIDSKAFTAEIFLSYRKVDLGDAREFMKDLHNVDGLQGISIWYDHFLTAGREFDLEIREAIENCDAFVLLVTPNITKKNNAGELNYVARKEVPFAIEKAKTLLPIEVKPRDTATFAIVFPTIGEPVQKSALNKAFREKLGETAYINVLGSERAYLLGMAYLRGHKVERDTERAIKLLEAATTSKDKFALDAAEQLAQIFEEGLGGNYSINYSNALQWWQKAGSLSERINGKKHKWTADIYNKIGRVYNIMGEYTSALDFHNKAIKIYIAADGAEDSKVGITYSNIGKVYIKLGKTLGINVLYDALKIFQKNHGENHPYVAGAYMDIGINHIENESSILWFSLADDFNKITGKENTNTAAKYALTNFLKALVIYKNIYGNDHYKTSIAYNYLGKVYVYLEKYDEAIKNLNVALKIVNDIYGEEHLYLAHVYANFGLLYKHLNQYENALYYFDKAFKIRAVHFDANNINYISMYNAIGSVYLRFNKHEEALEYFIKEAAVIIKSYEDNPESIKNERKMRRNVRMMMSSLTLMQENKFLWIMYMIAILPIYIASNFTMIIKFLIGGFKIFSKLKRAKKTNSPIIETAEGVGQVIYSTLNFLDKNNLNILTKISEKYIFIADLYNEMKKYEKALQYYKLAFGLKKRTGEDAIYHGNDNFLLYLKIGVIYIALNDYSNAFEYCHKILKYHSFTLKMKMLNKKKKRKDNDEEDEDVVDFDVVNTNVAELFHSLGQIYYAQKNYQESLVYFNKAIEIHELLPYDTDISDDNEYIRSYYAIAMIYCKRAIVYKEMGEFEKSLISYNKALESSLYDEKANLNEIIDAIDKLHSNDTDGKYSHLNIVMIYYGANVVSLRINKVTKSFDIDVTINSSDDEDLTKLYSFVGNAYMKLNDQNSAFEVYDKALAAYTNLMKNISDNGEEDDEGQLKLLKEKLAVEIKRYGNEHINVAKTYYSLGLVYRSLNVPKKRLEYYKKGLEIRIKVQGEEHADTATQYNNVAVAYNALGDFESSLEYHKKSIAIRTKIFGEEHADTASSYANIGYVYRDSGDHKKALEYYEKAFVIYKKVAPKNHKKQIELLEQILKMKQEIYGEAHEIIAMSQNDLGVIYFNLGNNGMALDCACKALEIRLKIFGEEHSLTALSYSNIGVAHNMLKQYDKSMESHDKSLEIRKKIFGEVHADTAASYYNIGIVYKNKGDYENALGCYRTALEIREKLFQADDQRIKAVQDSIKEIGNKIDAK